MDKLPDKVNMLLDVSNFHGETGQRLAPILIFFAVASPPLVLYFYIGARFVPFRIFLIFYILYVIKVALVTIGEESRRVEQFKRQLYDVYSSAYDKMDIKSVRKDGCIEYETGIVAYMFVAENGAEEHAVIRGQSIKEIIATLASDFDFDIYIQNIYTTEELFKRYDTIDKISDPEVARDYVDSIDFAIDKARLETLAVRTIMILKEHKSNYNKLYNRVLSISRSDSVKIYKEFKLCDAAMVEEIIQRDLDTYVNLTDLQMQKHYTGDYEGAKVIAYDVEERLTDKDRLTTKKTEDFTVNEFMNRN